MVACRIVWAVGAGAAALGGAAVACSAATWVTCGSAWHRLTPPCCRLPHETRGRCPHLRHRRHRRHLTHCRRRWCRPGCCPHARLPAAGHHSWLVPLAGRRHPLHHRCCCCCRRGPYRLRRWQRRCGHHRSQRHQHGPLEPLVPALSAPLSAPQRSAQWRMRWILSLRSWRVGVSLPTQHRHHWRQIPRPSLVASLE